MDCPTIDLEFVVETIYARTTSNGKHYLHASTGALKASVKNGDGVQTVFAVPLRYGESDGTEDAGDYTFKQFTAAVMAAFKVNMCFFEYLNFDLPNQNKKLKNMYKEFMRRHLS